LRARRRRANTRGASREHFTVLSQADRSKAADLLIAAETERKPIVQLSKTWPDITIEDAYAISSEVTRRKIAAGAKLIGHKIGLTSKAMQQSSQIDEPDYGHLLDDMMLADGAKVPHGNYCVPRVEPELAFVLGRPLKGPGIGLLDVLRATEYVVPAIEIIDARVQNPRKIYDTVADNGAAAGIVLGGRPVKPTDVDLRSVRSSTAIRRSRRLDWPRACSATQRWVSPGLRIRWGALERCLSPAISCCPDPSRGPSGRTRAIPFTPTLGRWAPSRCNSPRAIR
jgi:2-keto-4-pentenoate hydratase